MVLRLRPMLGDVLGDDAELFELAALVSDPGAPRQPMHPDTTRQKDAPGDGGEGASAGGVGGEGDAPAVVTAFVALQDVDEEMGPTVFLPRSQSAEAHAAFYADDASGSTTKAELLRTAPQALGLLRTGDASLFDSRLLHAGGANRSPRRRVLFYFSFKVWPAFAPPASRRPPAGYASRPSPHPSHTRTPTPPPSHPHPPLTHPPSHPPSPHHNHTTYSHHPTLPPPHTPTPHTLILPPSHPLTAPVPRLAAECRGEAATGHSPRRAARAQARRARAR